MSTATTETRSENDTLTPRIEQGEAVRFEVGFNKDRLAQLNPDELVDKKTWGREEKIERVREVVDLYSQLPEKMQFAPGVTAIFGENGAGKTMLADVIVMALKMEQFRQEHGLPHDADLQDAEFYPSLPGRLKSSGEDNQVKERQHAQFVARIANCVDVGSMVVHDPEGEIGDAMRTPAALGNVAMGLSSRQAIDMLGAMQGRHNSSPSVKIYDEPELGMSPRRQKETLLPMLSERVADGSVELVPSNSIVLYESTLPRIDLEVPEQGIITPIKV